MTTRHSSADTTVSVVIVTRNRREDVIRAVRSALEQAYGGGLDVVVYDDASTDGTADAIAATFPDASVVRVEQQVGYIVLRNRGFREARGQFVFSIDDDAYFTDQSMIARTVALFQNYPKVAAVALPYAEPHARMSETRDGPAAGDSVRNYIGCAHAVRTHAVLAIDGYREILVHQTEERDLCLRLFAAGWQIVYGDGEPIIHLRSPKRSQDRLNYYGVRNTLLVDFLNAPACVLPMRLALDTVGLLRHRFSLAALPFRLLAIAGGYAACLRYIRHRSPVPLTVWRRWRQLPNHPVSTFPRRSGVAIERPEAAHV